MSDHRGRLPAELDPTQYIPPSTGTVRRFLEEAMFPPVGEQAQREAGEASALTALADTYNLNPDQFKSGLDVVLGARRAASSRDGDTPTSQPPRSTVSLQQLRTLPPETIAKKIEKGELIPRTPNQGSTVAAFLDVDNTLIQGASILLFARGMAKHKFFSTGEILMFLWKQIKFMFTGKENIDDVNSGRDQALSFIRGRRVADMTPLAQDIFDQSVSGKIWPGTRELAHRHIDAGHQVWLVTATPVQLAQIIARELGFTGALGTVAEIDDEGRFTGALVGDILHGDGKKHAVAALAAYEGLELDKCTAYSDSFNDLPMLSMVGHAVAVNPDSRLKKEAKKRGWEVRDYRYIRKALKRFVPITAATVAMLARSLRKGRAGRSAKA